MLLIQRFFLTELKRTDKLNLTLLANLSYAKPIDPLTFKICINGRWIGHSEGESN